MMWIVSITKKVTREAPEMERNGKDITHPFMGNVKGTQCGMAKFTEGSSVDSGII